MAVLLVINGAIDLKLQHGRNIKEFRNKVIKFEIRKNNVFYRIP